MHLKAIMDQVNMSESTLRRVLVFTKKNPETLFAGCKPCNGVNKSLLNQCLGGWLKGTVRRDFLPLVFFFKQLLLAPVDKPSNDFNFFRKFADIFDYFGASPVLTTPVSDTFTVLESFTGVNGTGKKFLTGKACIRRCQ